jgi:hypothetical protein
MKKLFITSVIVLFCLTNRGFASSIQKISLSELYAKSDLIVMAQVVNLERNQTQDIVTIETSECLKGNNILPYYTFILVSSGELKDFDPALMKGDTGVFFLKKREGAQSVEKAYWGSVATFSKNHFFLSKEKPESFAEKLEIWRAYRIKQKEIIQVEDYEKGFRKGFHESAGLVDGSPDFNLGHSDGMQAKMNKLPE